MTDQTQDLQQLEEESIALRTILDGPTKPFFDEIWQQSCVLLSTKVETSDSDVFDMNAVNASPYKELLRHGWSSLVKLLEDSRQRYDGPNLDSFPLLFKNRENVSPAPYQGSLFHAYLDGCSVVINHADETCPYLAALCLDLQKSMPHAYANTYLTPPNSQAVPPHADDRDVFVMQIYGEKHWKVYKSIPIPYPYPHEQVGKDGLDVPPPVLDGELLMDRILKPGDVLYMPRGYVHEASTTGSSMPSYHATIALATHDWTLAGLLTTATQHTLSRVIENRMALPVHLGRRRQPQQLNHTDDEASTLDVQTLKAQIDAAWDELKEKVTADQVIANLTHRYNNHNRRVLPLRQAVMHRAAFSGLDNNSNAAATAAHDLLVVGPKAASKVQLSTIVRAATPEEKESVVPPNSQQQQQPSRGLNVREVTADIILQIVGRLKQERGLTCRVADLKTLASQIDDSVTVCDLTLLSFAKTCVEMGALAVVRGL